MKKNTNISAKYLEMKYGPVNQDLCNVHYSSGTFMAKEWHYHDFYQIYFIVQGSLIHHTAEASTRLFRGDSFVIPPFCSHYIEIDEEPPVFYSFSFYREFLSLDIQQSNEVISLLDNLILNKLLTRVTFTPEQLYPMEKLMTFSLQEYQNQLSGWEVSLKGMLSSILTLFYRAYTQKKFAVSEKNTAISECVSYIENNLDMDITLKSMLNLTYMSASTFYRTFQKVTGQSFQNYLSLSRIKEACRLLRQTSLPISIIESKCGYSDHSAFYRAFRKYVNHSPSEYRKSFL